MIPDYEAANADVPATEWKDMPIDYYPGSGVRLDEARRISTQAEDAGFGPLGALRPARGSRGEHDGHRIANRRHRGVRPQSG